MCSKEIKLEDFIMVWRVLGKIFVNYSGCFSISSNYSNSDKRKSG